MNWKHIKILHDYYEQKINSIKQDLLNEPLLNQYNKYGYFSTEQFNEYKGIYESKHLNEFFKINNFLLTNNLEDSNFEVEQLNILQQIYNDKEQIIETENISRKEISTKYFNGSKILKKNSKLYEAVLQILEIQNLAEDENDLQYLWILHPKFETKAVLLCENDNYIRTKQRNDNIEIWYAGGANTNKLQFVTKSDCPKYYLCDWDNNGLTIYQRIKTKYLPEIELIIPNEPIKFLKKPKNHWKSKIDYSLFSNQAIELVKYLVDNSLWIEEESIKFDINRLAKE
jgi:hypothetical protein